MALKNSWSPGLTTRIFIGMILWIIIGLLLYGAGSDSLIGKYLVGGLFNIVGEIFKNCISLLVIPLVFVSLVNGSAKMGDIARLGRIGLKTVSFYLTTTAIAISCYYCVIGALIVRGTVELEFK